MSTTEPLRRVIGRRFSPSLLFRNTIEPQIPPGWELDNHPSICGAYHGPVWVVGDWIHVRIRHEGLVHIMLFSPGLAPLGVDEEVWE